MDTLKSMQVVLRIVNPRLELESPKVTNQTREVKPVALEKEQAFAIAGRLKEPYAVLVLLLWHDGLRIEEALGIKLAEDLQGHVLRIQRVIYERNVYGLAEAEQRNAPIRDADLLERLRALGMRHEWLPVAERHSSRPR